MRRFKRHAEAIKDGGHLVVVALAPGNCQGGLRVA